MAELWITMTHPNLPDNEPVEATFNSFVKLHEKKGWVVVKPEDVLSETLVEAHARVFGKGPSPKKKKSSAN